MRNPVLRGESVGRSLIARTDRRRLEARILPGAGKHPVGDKARADRYFSLFMSTALIAGIVLSVLLYTALSKVPEIHKSFWKGE